MRKLTVSSMLLSKNSQFQDVVVSAIRLQGKWLAELGFTSGCKVEVVEKQGELIIRLLEGENAHEASQVHDQSGRRSAAAGEGEGPRQSHGRRERRD